MWSQSSKRTFTYLTREHSQSTACTAPNVQKLNLATSGAVILHTSKLQKCRSFEADFLVPMHTSRHPNVGAARMASDS